MPVYEFACEACGERTEVLTGRGDTADRPCRACGGRQRHRFSRVAVRYTAWGFDATDALVRDTRGKDLGALRERAEQISDGDG